MKLRPVELITQWCPTPCNSLDWSLPGFPVHHQLPKPTQTHVHRVRDAIQSSHPLSSPSLPAFKLSQYQGFFLMNQFFTSGSQSIWFSASASFLPMNIQNSFPLGWTGWMVGSSCYSSDSQESSPTAQFRSINSSVLSFLTFQLSHPYMNTGKTIALTRWTSVGKVMSLLVNMLSRLVIAFLARSKHLLASWLQSPSAVILEPPKIKSATVSTVSPSICHEVMGPDAMILVFWMLSFKPTFSLSSFTFKRLFSSSLLSAIRVVSSVYLRLLILSWQSWFQLVLLPAWHFTLYILHIS